MYCEKISLIINSICKKLRITYNSKNSHYIELKEDIQKMANVYLQLKEITGLMKEIEDRHSLNGLRTKFDNLIRDLDMADHNIIKLARELRDKNV
jgi:hypothetical protein